MSHHPRKRWGQNFLHDRRAIERIIEAIKPAAGDVIVEIGPGEGVLTRPLLATGVTVHAVEIDRDLAANLGQWPQAGDTLRVHTGDALAFDLATVAASGPVRVVGNLPYNISTPILFHMLAQRAHIRDLHLMLQREVVERMAAPAGTRTRGRLSVMLQAWCRVEPLLHLPPGAFRPPPQVDSTVVRLRLLDQPLVAPEHERAFADLVRLAFGGRRKTLRRTLAPRLDAETIAAQGVDPGLRPERLEVTDFAALAAACNPLPAD